MPSSLTDNELYSPAFFDREGTGMIASAEVIVPFVMKLVDPQSVLDVGCGRGAWLQVFERQGIRTIQGVDGPHVRRDQLLIRSELFIAMDLRNPTPIDGRFDLAVCLEVAEHLPASAAPQLVKMLATAAPVILFSAAIPGQGGTAHINEQWPWYWRQLFASHGYQLIDPIRPTILLDKRVAPWYRQNVVMYCSAAALESRPCLKSHLREEIDAGIEWVHWDTVQNLARDLIMAASGKKLAGALLGRLWRRMV
jgi:hypothetical protein